VLVRCKGGVCSRASSGALYIGGPRRWPRTGFFGEVYGSAGHWSGWFRSCAPACGSTDSILVLSASGYGGLGGARRNGAARARRRQGARSARAAPRRRRCMRALARRWPRGTTRSLGWRRTALSRRSAFCRPLRRYGRRRTRRHRRARAPPPPGRCQVRMRGAVQGEGAMRNVPECTVDA